MYQKTRRLLITWLVPSIYCFYLPPWGKDICSVLWMFPELRENLQLSHRMFSINLDLQNSFSTVCLCWNCNFLRSCLRNKCGLWNKFLQELRVAADLTTYCSMWRICSFHFTFHSINLYIIDTCKIQTQQAVVASGQFICISPSQYK